MRGQLRTLGIAAALGAATFVVVPSPKGLSPAEERTLCIEWQHAYGTAVPPDLWGIAGADERTTGFSTESDMDPDAVEAVLAGRPDGCPLLNPPPGARKGAAWQWDEASPAGL